MQAVTYLIVHLIENNGHALYTQCDQMAIVYSLKSYVSAGLIYLSGSRHVLPGAIFHRILQ